MFWECLISRRREDLCGVWFLLVLPIDLDTLCRYPLQWAHVYIPVIPAHLRALVEVPWPFLVGVHSRYSEDILGVFDERAPESEEPMIVNLDTRSVLVPDAITLPSLPAASIAMFTDRCLDLPLDYEMWCASSSFPHPETDEGARAFHAEHLQKEIQELGLSLMIDILGDVRRHMLFDVSPPIFDLDKFLAAQPPESRDFFRTLCNNGSFRSFQRSRHQHELDFFDIMVRLELFSLLAVVFSDDGGLIMLSL